MEPGFDKETMIIQNLRDANCDNAFIRRFLEINTADKVSRIRLLKQQRAVFLHIIHENEKYLEYLDYLVYRITNEVKDS